MLLLSRLSQINNNMFLTVIGLIGHTRTMENFKPLSNFQLIIFMYISLPLHREFCIRTRMYVCILRDKKTRHDVKISRTDWKLTLRSFSSPFNLSKLRT